MPYTAIDDCENDISLQEREPVRLFFDDHNGTRATCADLQTDRSGRIHATFRTSDGRVIKACGNKLQGVKPDYERLHDGGSSLVS